MSDGPVSSCDARTRRHAPYASRAHPRNRPDARSGCASRRRASSNATGMPVRVAYDPDGHANAAYRPLPPPVRLP